MGVSGTDFMTSQKQNMTELAATIYLVNRMSQVGL